MYYRTCPDCGSNLDPGEKCDCISQKEENRKEMEKKISADKRGQYRMIFEGVHYEKAVGC